MSFIELSHDGPWPAECRGGVLTIGNFDGVHLGHASLVDKVRQLADQRGVPAQAMTFDPHPLAILRPAQFQPILTTIAQRAVLLRQAGIDHVLVMKSDSALLGLSAREFFDKVIVGGIRGSGLVEGPNFGFGKNRGGDVETLFRFATESDLTVEIVTPVQSSGTIVSSNRVRNALGIGDVVSAAAWLGRPYSLSGTVGKGQERGRTLGFPTANLTAVQTLIPRDGVYAGRATVSDSSTNCPAAINIGPNPTFGENLPKIEAHLLDYSGDLYGKSLKLELIARVRDTRKFHSVDSLKEQIDADVARVRQQAEDESGIAGGNGGK